VISANDNEAKNFGFERSLAFMLTTTCLMVELLAATALVVVDVEASAFLTPGCRRANHRGRSR
jgi:hypothetical protein